MFWTKWYMCMECQLVTRQSCMTGSSWTVLFVECSPSLAGYVLCCWCKTPVTQLCLLTCLLIGNIIGLTKGLWITFVMDQALLQACSAVKKLLIHHLPPPHQVLAQQCYQYLHLYVLVSILGKLNIWLLICSG